MHNTPSEVLDLTIGRVDLERSRIQVGRETRRLTAREVALLRFLLAAEGVTVSRETLLVEVWGYSPDVVSRAVDYTVTRLRGKIELDSQNPDHLLTVHGEGYRLRLPAVGEQVANQTLVKPLGTALFGRQDNLEQVRSLLTAGTRPVTLVGPGGIGKTRLSWEVASSIDPNAFPGGAWVCSVGSCRSEAGILEAVAGTLGLSLVSSTAGGIEQVGRALAHRGRCLVLLDNLEQVIGPASSLLKQWMSMAPEASFLVTSRQPLEMDGETCVRLEGLAVSQGVSLFRERALAQGVQLPEGRDGDALHRLVQALDGSPLAIELAAAQIQLMEPATLFARLEHQLDLLGRERRDKPARHADLRACLDWSWALLGADEKWMLQCCAVFESAFGLDAIEALQPPVERPLAVVRGLISRSLVQVVAKSGAVGRFRLAQSLRLFVREKAGEDGASGDVARRHAEWFVARNEAHLDAHQLELVWRDRAELSAVITRMVAAEPDLSARAALVLTRVRIERGPLMSSHEDLQRCLQTDLDAGLKGRVRAAHATVLRLLGQPEAAEQELIAVIDTADGLKDPSLARQARRRLALLYQELGRFDEAMPLLVAALDGENGPRDRGIALAGLCVAHGRAGRLDEGIKAVEEASRLHRTDGDVRNEAQALRLKAWLLRRQGDPQAACVCLESALGLYADQDVPREKAWVWLNLGVALSELGQLDRACQLLSAALEVQSAVGFLSGEAQAQVNLGSALVEMGHASRAVVLYEQAERTFDKTGEKNWLAMTCLNRGIAHLEQDQFKAAEMALHAALSGYRGISHGTGTFLCLRFLGTVAADSGAVEAAQDWLGQASAVQVDADPVQSGLGQLAQGHLALALARANPDAAPQHLLVAEQTVSPVSGLDQSLDLRVAVRLLKRRIKETVTGLD